MKSDRCTNLPDINSDLLPKGLIQTLGASEVLQPITRGTEVFTTPSLNLLRKLRQRFPQPRDFIRHLREQLARLQQIPIPRALC